MMYGYCHVTPKVLALPKWVLGASTTEFFTQRDCLECMSWQGLEVILLLQRPGGYFLITYYVSRQLFLKKQ